jgi:hypothetical protein
MALDWKTDHLFEIDRVSPLASLLIIGTVSVFLWTMIAAIVRLAWAV